MDEVREQGVKVCMLAVGDTHVELLEPLGSETSVGKFLAKRGPGMHHIAGLRTYVPRSLS